jgi:hypothetical protein
MKTLEKSRASLLASEGCQWATLTANQLNLAIENHFASYGFAFGYGHGEEARDALVADYLAPSDSTLAAAIQPALKTGFEARVHRNLQAVIDKAIATRSWTSAKGWAHDIVCMMQTLSWEFTGGTRLFGIGGLIGDGSEEGLSEVTWMVGGYLDPLGHGPDPEWMYFALAEDALGDVDAIKKLTQKSVGEKAFGPSN